MAILDVLITLRPPVLLLVEGSREATVIGADDDNAVVAPSPRVLVPPMTARRDDLTPPTPRADLRGDFMFARLTGAVGTLLLFMLLVLTSRPSGVVMGLDFVLECTLPSALRSKSTNYHQLHYNITHALL